MKINKATPPWIVITVAIIVVPFIVMYMLIRHPKEFTKAWKESKKW